MVSHLNVLVFFLSVLTSVMVNKYITKPIQSSYNSRVSGQSLRGTPTSNQNWACFMVQFKHSFEKWFKHSKANFLRNSTNMALNLSRPSNNNMCVMMILYEECNTCRNMLQALQNFCPGIVKFSCFRLYTLDYRIHSYSRICPIRAHPSYFEVISHKIINHLPRSSHKACIRVQYDWELAWKWPKSSIFESILSTNIEINKRPPKMIYLSALGPYWNEYGVPTLLNNQMTGIFGWKV